MASTVPSNCRALWFASAASIPASWSQDTNFNGKYLQGDGDSYTGPANGGGSHNHTSIASHTHSELTHTHEVSGATATGTGLPTKTGTSTYAAPQMHDHKAAASGVPDAATSSDATTIVVVAVSHELRHWRLFLIKPDDGNQDIPDDASCLIDETSLPTGFTKQANVEGQFIKGSLTGNSNQRSSDTVHTTVSHNHTWSMTHGHNEERSGSQSAVSLNTQTGSNVRRIGPHHLITLGATNPGSLANKAPDTGLASNGGKPLYIEMLAIKNTSGGATTPIGVILPYVASLADPIPDGWSYCDGTGGTPDLRDRFVQMTETDGNVGDTGGSNAHSHGTATHKHTFASTHTHGLTETDDGTVTTALFGLQGLSIPDHSHSWTVSSEAPDTTFDGFSTDSVDGRPEYRTVVFVKKTSEPSVSEQPSLALGINF